MAGYRVAKTDRPPSRISQLGRVVNVMSEEFALTSREIYKRAFDPHEAFENCKATICTAQARDLAAKDPWTGGRARLYRLTPKGGEIKPLLR